MARKDITLLTDGNAKMKYTGKVNKAHCWTFSIPAKKTCPFAGECKAFCFAGSGNYICPDPQACYARNFEASKRHDFPTVMIAQVKEAVRLDSKRGKQVVVRIHDTGDFYSRAYLAKWIQIAEACPEVLFYGYTKSHPFFQGVKCPDNFRFIPSEGGKRDDMIKGRPRARVVPVGYVPGPGEILGDKDDLMNLMRVVDQKMVLCLEAHGARRGKVK